jgi:hypothetical protein
MGPEMFDPSGERKQEFTHYAVSLIRKEPDGGEDVAVSSELAFDKRLGCRVSVQT